MFTSKTKIKVVGLSNEDFLSRVGIYILTSYSSPNRVLCLAHYIHKLLVKTLGEIKIDTLDLKGRLTVLTKVQGIQSVKMDVVISLGGKLLGL